MHFLLIEILITVYSIIFIVGAYYLYSSYYRLEDLYDVSNKASYFVWMLFLEVVMILFFIFNDLSSKGYMFADQYRFDITKSEKNACVSIGNDINKDEIFLHNKNSTSHHIRLCKDGNKSIVQLTSNLRKAIVDGKLLSYSANKDTNLTITQTSFSNGSYIRLGRADYRIYYKENTLILDNTFFNFDIFSFYQIYSTTTLPDLTNEASKDNTYTSIWIVFFMLLAILLIATLSVSAFLHNLKNYKSIGEKRYLLYPLISFLLFSIFLYFASFVNFTVMYFYQFNSFAKGSLFSEIVVAFIIYMVALVAGLLYHFSKYKYRIVFFISVIFVLSFVGFSIAYSDQLSWRSIVILVSEQGFLYMVFGILLGLLLASQNTYSKHNQTYLFILGDKVNFKLFYILSLLTPLLVIVMGVASLSAQVQEGTGIVVIETIKLFTLFLLIPYIFTNAIYQDTLFSIRSLNIGKVTYVMILICTILGLGVLLKDKGSILQIILAILLVFFFFYDSMKKHGFFQHYKKQILSLVVLSIGIAIVFYNLVLDGNIRIAMWTNPLMQEVSLKGSDFMHSYEQIARGLYLIKGSSFLPTDFINTKYIVLPNIHTDFIGAFFVNTFGIIGFIAMLVGIAIVLFSFKNAINHFRKHIMSEIDYFIYGLNVIFIVYMLSYFIINITSILQIIPLTDVPLPFLTYSRGVLILYVMIFVFVLAVNMFYLKYTSKKRR